MLAKNTVIWELLESEADVRLFFDREGFEAEGPGVIISSGLGHKPKTRGDKFTVWFGRGLGRECFKTFKDACLHALEIVDKANRPISLRVEGPRAKRFLKIQSTRTPEGVDKPRGNVS